MRKRELISDFAHRSGLRNDQATRLFQVAIDTLAHCMVWWKEDITLRDFGDFRIVTKDGRKTIEFKPCKWIRDAVNSED